MVKRRLPLPTAVRSTFTGIRWGGFGVLALTLLLAWLYLAVGWRIQASIAVAIGLSTVALTWLSPYSTWWPALLAVPGLLLAALFQSIPLALVALGAAGFLTWRRRRPQSSGIVPTDVEITAPDAVMPNASEALAVFRAAGFDQVGALSVRVRPTITIVVSLLLAADRRSFAGVTDVALEVVSLFEHDRSLTTRNSGTTALHPSMLPNDLGGATPRELIDGHRAALHILEKRGLEPIELEGEDLSSLVLEGERRVIRWMERNPQRLGPVTGQGPLTNRRDLDGVIRRWQSSQPML